MSETGFNFPIGTVEEGQACVGQTSGVSFAQVEVNWPQIKFYASALEDANPCYWDEAYANERHGSIVAPPGMLMVWGMPMDFNPIAPKAAGGSAMNIPLPGKSVINVATETEFFRPIKLGESLNSVDELISVSDEKKTKLGIGNFIVTKATYRTGSGEVVGTNTNTLFRFNPHD